MATTKKSKLSPEMLSKLKGFSVVSKTVECPIEIEGVPAEYWPTFKMKMLTTESVGILKEKRRATLSEGKTETEAVELENALNELVRAHVCGWSGLYDLTTGYEFEFKADSTVAETPPADFETFAALPVGLKAHLLKLLYQIAGLA